MKISGKIVHKRFMPNSWDIRVQSSTFKPMNSNRYKLTLAADLHIQKSQKKGLFNPLKVRGKITIPRLLFHIPDYQKKARRYQESKDIYVLGERTKRSKQPTKEAPPGSDLLDVDLRIRIPRNCIIKNELLRVELATNRDLGVRIRMKEGTLRLSGGIEIIRGTFSQYGKRFEIKKGSNVSFTGQRVSLANIASELDPRLSIQAGHRVNVSKGTRLSEQGHKNANVSIIVSGSLQHIEVNFGVQDASTGDKISMDKANALSLVLTGRTTSELSGSQQRALSSQAIGMLGQALASKLRNQVSGTLPIDVLNIEAGSSVSDLKVDFGWYLSSSVYLQFSAQPVPREEESFWEALIQMSLSQRFSLEASVGQAKRNELRLFRGSGRIYFRMKY